MSDDGSEAEHQEGPTIGTYTGERNDSHQRHGRGKNVFPNGDVYEGSYANGKRNGNGCYIWKATGARYTGDYFDNIRSGNGEFVYPDGSKYTGQFAAGKRHGIGAYTFANGDVYQGAWENDLKHGEGTYTFKASSSKKKGTWTNGVLTGVGEIIHADHTILGRFTSSEFMETPAKVTFFATGGYSKIINDPILLGQEPPSQAV